MMTIREKSSLGGPGGSPPGLRASQVSLVVGGAAAAALDGPLQRIRGFRCDMRRMADQASVVEEGVDRLELEMKELEELLAASGAATDTAAARTALLQRALWMQRRARRIASQASCIEAGISRLACRLGDLAAGIPSSGVPHTAMPRRRARRRTRVADEQVLEADALRGVPALKFERHADGSASVQIGGGEPMKLSCGLANLLALLASDRPSDDHLVGWKLVRDLAAQLGELEHRVVGRHALTQRIWRLREALDAAGVNWRYVQRRPHTGVRFALWRAGANPDRPAQWVGDTARPDTIETARVAECLAGPPAQ